MMYAFRFRGTLPRPFSAHLRHDTDRASGILESATIKAGRRQTVTFRLYVVRYGESEANLLKSVPNTLRDNTFIYSKQFIRPREEM